MSDDVRIVAATEKDTPIILHMIRGLAEYEKLSDRVVATESSLREQLFGARPVAEVCLLYVGEQPVGFAAYFHTFSTFASRPGMYLGSVRRAAVARARLRAAIVCARGEGRDRAWMPQHEMGGAAVERAGD